VTPVLSYYLLSGSAHGQGDNFIVRPLKRGTRSLLDWAFDHRRSVLATVAVAIVAAAYATTVLPRSFLPPFNEGTLDVAVQFNPPAFRLAESQTARLDRGAFDCASFPRSSRSDGRTGRAELDEHAEGVHFSEIDVDVERSERSKADIYADIRERAFRPAGFSRHWPAHQPSSRPHAVGRACADRPEDFWRRSRSSATDRRNRAPKTCGRARRRRSADREAGFDPSIADRGRL